MTRLRTRPVLLATACLAVSALAQTSPAGERIGQAMALSEEQQLSDYLALLQQIAPAPEEAARVYLAAYRLHCGRALDSAQLRRAMAREGGDPVLMGLVRAAAARDTAARQRLAAQVRCTPKAVP